MAAEHGAQACTSHSKSVRHASLTAPRIERAVFCSLMEIKLIASRFKVRFVRCATLHSAVGTSDWRFSLLQTLSRGGLLTNESFQRVIQARLASLPLRVSVRAFVLTYLPAPAALGRCS